MLVKNDYVNKTEVVYVKENDNMQDVMDKLVTSGYRCIPVLDEAGEKYVGNVYKVHLLKHEREHSLDAPLNELIADRKNSYVREEDAFFKVFKSIKQLPFLAVVDEDKNFLGILTNGNVIQVLENAWGVHNGSYSLTIGTIEYAGALQKMLSVVNEYCNVQSVISLNNNSQYVRRVCVVLPEEVDETLMQKVVKALDDNNFTITDIEKLN
ncbi:MAG TPA: cyclic di-AMP binding protein CbpA [Cerasibacillus sp.]|uniref:cyclic di-AMP binding protein CbpA n=1 Tax=Cerasibacillus sp. TaxID=2498711 RepID=UPI002F4138E3